MAHELVFRTLENGDRVARMVYRKRDGGSVPWHGFGQPYDIPMTVEAVHSDLGTESEVSIQPLFHQEGNDYLKLDDGCVSKWEDKVLGIVGPSRKPYSFVGGGAESVNRFVVILRKINIL